MWNIHIKCESQHFSIWSFKAWAKFKPNLNLLGRWSPTSNLASILQSIRGFSISLDGPRLWKLPNLSDEPPVFCPKIEMHFPYWESTPRKHCHGHSQKLLKIVKELFLLPKKKCTFLIIEDQYFSFNYRGYLATAFSKAPYDCDHMGKALW